MVVRIGNSGFRIGPGGGIRVGTSGFRVGGKAGLPALAYDPVIIFIGDSQVLTQGDTTNTDTLAGVWPASAKVFVANQTLGGAFDQYAPGVSATPATGRTGLNYSSNKNNAGPEIGFIPQFLDAYSNDLRLINLSAPGSYMGRGAIKGTCTGYVSSGVSGVAGNIFTLSTGVMPDAGTLITGAGIPSGTIIASFGAGGNTRYVYQAGASGFGLSFAAGTSGAPITVSKYGYAYSLAEGTLYSGSDGAINNGYKSRALNALSSLVSGGKNPKVPAIFILLGTNDMGGTTEAAFFSADMSAFIAALKTDFASYLPTGYKIVLVRVKTGAAGSATVRAAQQSIADGDANVYLMDTDGGAFTLSDGTHFTCPTTARTYTGRAAIGSSGYDIFSGASAGI